MKLGQAYTALMASNRLPTPGPVALELANLSRQPEVDLGAVARVVSTDPALTARVMHAANNAARGARTQTASLDRALVTVGLRGIARIALETSVLKSNRDGLPEFDYARFWAESLARAVAAQVIAGHVPDALPDEAFTYGLLAGIGRLALVSVRPDSYRRMLLTLRTASPRELAEAESALFEVDTALLSALMLNSWGMPALWHAVNGTEGRDQSTERREAATALVCRLGGELAGLLVGHETGRDALRTVMRALADLGINTELAAHLFPDVVARYEATGPHLGIATPPVASLGELYARAAHPSTSP